MAKELEIGGGILYQAASYWIKAVMMAAGGADQWDCTVVDVASRFIVALEIGKRTPDTLKLVRGDFAQRTGGIVPALITTDAFQAYAPILMAQYGVPVVPAQTVSSADRACPTSNGPRALSTRRSAKP